MPDNTEAAIIAGERARANALLTRDKAAVARLLADGFTYTHGSGKVDTRDSYLASFDSDAVKFVSADHADLSVRRFGDAAVLAGNLDVVLIPKGEAQRSPKFRFISVWVRSGDAWKMVAFQNTMRALRPMAARRVRTIAVHAMGDERVHLAPARLGHLRLGRLQTLCNKLAVTELSPFAAAGSNRCRTCFGKVDAEGMLTVEAAGKPRKSASKK